MDISSGGKFYLVKPNTCMACAFDSEVVQDSGILHHSSPGSPQYYAGIKTDPIYMQQEVSHANFKEKSGPRTVAGRCLSRIWNGGMMGHCSMDRLQSAVQGRPIGRWIPNEQE